jgi:ATP-binding cassette subfamily B protein
MRITGKGIWDEPDDAEEAVRTLKRLPELGVNFIDTADSYGPDVSEELIREALSTLMRGRTVLAIAHRLSTLRSFDRIMVIQKGEIVQDGRPDALLSKGGAYKSLIDLEFSRLHSAAA